MAGTVTISWLENGPPAPGVGASWQITISGGNAGFVPVTQSFTSSPAVFTGVPPDDPATPYTATLQEMDASGVARGAPLAGPFSVSNPIPVSGTPSNLSIVVS